VRRAIVRYAGVLTSVSKFSSVQLWTILPLSESTLHSAERNRRQSAAR
jgi:hypothetical protein